MSTRAVFTFSDPDHRGRPLVVYKHHDGYPEGALAALRRTLDSGLCWPLPRFEADEFAAAFVAANKPEGGGGIRLLGAGDWRDLAPPDITYVYHVIRFPSGNINVAGYRVTHDADRYATLAAGNTAVAAIRLRDLQPQSEGAI